MNRYYIKKKLVKENKKRKQERAFKALQLAMVPAIAYAQVSKIQSQYGYNLATAVFGIAEVCLNMSMAVVDICNNKHTEDAVEIPKWERVLNNCGFKKTTSGNHICYKNC